MTINPISKAVILATALSTLSFGAAHAAAGDINCTNDGNGTTNLCTEGSTIEDCESWYEETMYPNSGSWTCTVEGMSNGGVVAVPHQNHVTGTVIGSEDDSQGSTPAPASSSKTQQAKTGG